MTCQTIIAPAVALYCLKLNLVLLTHSAYMPDLSGSSYVLLARLDKIINALLVLTDWDKSTEVVAPVIVVVPLSAHQGRLGETGSIMWSISMLPSRTRRSKVSCSPTRFVK